MIEALNGVQLEGCKNPMVRPCRLTHEAQVETAWNSAPEPRM